MGARSGGAGGYRMGSGATPTASQLKAAKASYTSAKESYNKAAQALEKYVSGMTPGGPKPKGNYQTLSNKFLKASNKLDAAHSKWSKMKQIKKFNDIKAAG